MKSFLKYTNSKLFKYIFIEVVWSIKWFEETDPSEMIDFNSISSGVILCLMFKELHSLYIYIYIFCGVNKFFFVFIHTIISITNNFQKDLFAL